MKRRVSIGDSLSELVIVKDWHEGLCGRTALSLQPKAIRQVDLDGAIPLAYGQYRGKNLRTDRVEQAANLGGTAEV